MNWNPGESVDWTTPDQAVSAGNHLYCGNCGCDTPGCGCPRDAARYPVGGYSDPPLVRLTTLIDRVTAQQAYRRESWTDPTPAQQQEIDHWASILTGLEMARYCFFPQQPDANQALPALVKEVVDRLVALQATPFYDVGPSSAVRAMHELDGAVSDLARAAALPQAHCGDCHGTGVATLKDRGCTCDPGPEGQHHPYCGAAPCPRGCPMPPVRDARGNAWTPILRRGIDVP